MWQLNNQTPYAAERCFVRDRHGAEVWVVAVRATFSVGRDGALALVEPQPDVVVEPRFLDKPGQSSLLCDTDLVPFKPATDVLLLGHAYAPGGRQVTQLDVGFRVGELVRTLRIHGDRTWQRRLGVMSLSAPEPFTRMPLVYERAFGGAAPEAGGGAATFEPRNPVGRGFANEAAHLVGRPAPNLEELDDAITSWRSRPRPAGVGPVARNWSPRLELAGTHDQRWQEERFPLVPLDFDERFYQSAPEVQQVHGHLSGGELVVLHHLTPGRDEVRFALPRVFLGFRTFFGREVVEHRARLHTVLLEPDASHVTLVWGTQVPCHGKEHKLERTVILEKQLR
jgi:hypothetical protein